RIYLESVPCNLQMEGISNTMGQINYVCRGIETWFLYFETKLSQIFLIVK
ncbi:hypothetical protein L9F63_014901, partial [Diploptera punctata]